MKEKYESFGAFVVAMRQRPEVNLSLRRVAELMDYSAPFWSDVEKGRKNPPSLEKLEKLAVILRLTDEERTLMYDLAANIGKASVAPDLPEYINNKQFVAAALRTARDLNATEEEWEEFVNELKKRKG